MIERQNDTTQSSKVQEQLQMTSLQAQLPTLLIITECCSLGNYWLILTVKRPHAFVNVSYCEVLNRSTNLMLQYSFTLEDTPYVA